MMAQYLKLSKGIDHYFIVDVQKQHLVGVSQIFVPKVAVQIKTTFGTDISFYTEDRCLQILSKKGEGRIIFNKISERNFTDYFKQLVGWGEKKDYDTPEFFRGQKGLEDYFRSNFIVLAPEDEEFDPVKVSMVILADGSPQQPVIESKTIYCPEKKLLESCEKMPKWKPAYKDGEPVTKEVSFSIKVPKWLTSPDTMPAFHGGQAALSKLLSENMKYPVACEEEGIQGRVVCSFIIECDGSISNLKVAKSVHPALDQEALRVLSLMPNWTSGMKDGQKVRVKYSLPVTFRLQ
jgi:TonB family protein